LERALDGMAVADVKDERKNSIAAEFVGEDFETFSPAPGRDNAVPSLANRRAIAARNPAVAPVTKTIMTRSPANPGANLGAKRQEGEEGDEFQRVCETAT
jgi:hypothetical protein